MKKIELNLNIPSSKEELHEYLMEMFDFPDYYGKNLDALYDCLTDIDEPTAIGIHKPYSEYTEADDELFIYAEQVVDTFCEAEDENDNLAVFLM